MRRAVGVWCLWLWAAVAHSATELQFWHAMQGERGVVLDALVARFNASQPRVHVIATYHGPDAHRAALGAHREARGPHLVQAGTAAAAEMLAARTAVRPVWQVMSRAGRPADARAYAPAVSGAFAERGGRLVGLPFSAATPVLYVNRDALRGAGRDPDGLPATWDRLPEWLGAVYEAGGRCPLTSASPAWVLVENMASMHGQAYATLDNGIEGAGARLAFNTRLMVRWISVLATWHKAGYFVSAARGSEAVARFGAGECALLAASSAEGGALRAAAEFDLGVVRMPFYDDFPNAPQSSLADGVALWVLSGHAAAERAAAEFLAWLSQPAVQAEWHERTGDVPATLAAYRVSERQGVYARDPQKRVATRQLLERSSGLASRGIRLAQMPRIRAVIDDELEAVWRGDKPPLEALEAAVRRGNALLDQFGTATAHPPARRTGRRN